MYSPEILSLLHNLVAWIVKMIFSGVITSQGWNSCWLGYGWKHMGPCLEVTEALHFDFATSQSLNFSVNKWKNVHFFKHTVFCSNFLIFLLLTCFLHFEYCINNFTIYILLIGRKCLLIDPKEHPMLLAEPCSNTQQQREKWAECLRYLLWIIYLHFVCKWCWQFISQLYLIRRS